MAHIVFITYESVLYNYKYLYITHKNQCLLLYHTQDVHMGSTHVAIYLTHTLRNNYATSMRKSIYLLTTTPSSHTRLLLTTPIHSTYSPQLSSILLTCAKFKVWMTIVESGWNVWVWLVGVVSRRWVWLVGVGEIYGCGYWVWL